MTFHRLNQPSWYTQMVQTCLQRGVRRGLGQLVAISACMRLSWRFSACCCPDVQPHPLYMSTPMHGQGLLVYPSYPLPSIRTKGTMAAIVIDGLSSTPHLLIVEQVARCQQQAPWPRTSTYRSAPWRPGTSVAFIIDPLPASHRVSIGMNSRHPGHAPPCTQRAPWR